MSGEVMLKKSDGGRYVLTLLLACAAAGVLTWLALSRLHMEGLALTVTAALLCYVLFRVLYPAVSQLIGKGEGGRTVTEGTGVYCVVGMEARFKPVKVLYYGDGFVLVRADSDAEKTRLRSGDEVIVTAKDLYDGKVVG